MYSRYCSASNTFTCACVPLSYEVIVIISVHVRSMQKACDHVLMSAGTVSGQLTLPRGPVCRDVIRLMSCFGSIVKC